MNLILSLFVVIVGLSAQLPIIWSYSASNYYNSNKWSPMPPFQNQIYQNTASSNKRYFKQPNLRNYPDDNRQGQVINREWEQRRNGYNFNYNGYQSQGNVLHDGFKKDFQLTNFESELLVPQQNQPPHSHPEIFPVKKICTTWTSPEGIRFTLSPYGQLGNSIRLGSHYSKSGDDIIRTSDCDSTVNTVKSNYFSRPYYSPGSASDFVSIE